MFAVPIPTAFYHVYVKRVSSGRRGYHYFLVRAAFFATFLGLQIRIIELWPESLFFCKLPGSGAARFILNVINAKDHVA